MQPMYSTVPVIQFTQTVLVQTIQLSISMLFVLFNPIDRAFSGTTILGQIRPGSDGNDGVLRITQSSSNTGTSPSYWLVSYTEHSFEGGGPTLLQRSSRYIPQPQPTGQWINWPFWQTNILFYAIGWGFRIHWLLCYRGVRPLPTSALGMTLNNLMVRCQ